MSDGKPQLRFADASLESLFSGMDVTLADGHGTSVAVVGRAPLGVDVELVVARDAETWRGLLGDDGYALALRIAFTATEAFDTAATRVWTALESGKKANGLKRILPAFGSSLGGTWLSLSTSPKMECVCAVFKTVSGNKSTVIALTFGRNGR